MSAPQDNESPETDRLGTEKPETDELKTEELETAEPENEKPETEEPDMENPETKEPGTEEPETKEPETEEPETEKPESETSETEPPDIENQDKKKKKFYKTPYGFMLICEGLLSVCALVCMMVVMLSPSEQCLTVPATSLEVGGVLNVTTASDDNSRAVYTLFMLVIGLADAISQFVIFWAYGSSLKLDFIIGLVVFDAILLLNFFICTILSLHANGQCRIRSAARILTSAFLVALFLLFLGIVFLDYVRCRDFRQNMETSNVESQNKLPTAPGTPTAVTAHPLTATPSVMISTTPATMNLSPAAISTTRS